MKKRLAFCVVSLLFLLIIINDVWAHDKDSTRLITVSGEAQVKVVPDEVILNLGVETWDKDLKTAKSQNDIRVKRTLALASQYQIQSRHIQTSQIQIEPRYEHHYERRNFIGYFVRKSIVVTLKKISKFEDFLSSALSSDVNYVHGIQFRTTELRKHRDKARSMAIKAAYEKAQDLAKELGQKVGRPHTISESPSSWWSWYNSNWTGTNRGMMSQNIVQNIGSSSMSGDDSSISLGQISVNARVTVSFELIDEKQQIEEMAGEINVNEIIIKQGEKSSLSNTEEEVPTKKTDTKESNVKETDEKPSGEDTPVEKNININTDEGNETKSPDVKRNRSASDTTLSPNVRQGSKTVTQQTGVSQKSLEE